MARLAGAICQGGLGGYRRSGCHGNHARRPLEGEHAPRRHCLQRHRLVQLFGPLLLVLTPLVALVGKPRWRVGAHTVAQAVLATILAVVIT